MSQARFRYPIWVRGDLDGFFGLMVDNLVQVLTIVTFGTFICGFPPELIFTRILPGVAVSLLIGNLFYGIQAHYIARKHQRADTTALPYGINTPSVFAYVFFIMGPVYSFNVKPLGPEAAADLAWKAGLLACLVSGVIEFFGAFVAEKLRRVTPRAALLGVLAAVGIAFIASDFAFRIYTRPLVGLLPLGILLLAYFGHFRFPCRLPGGLLVILFGSALAWGALGFEALGQHLGWFQALDLEAYGAVRMSWEGLRAGFNEVHWIQPVFCGPEILSVLKQPEVLVPFLTVSIPMGLLNVLGSLQNIESAEAAGDRYPTAPSLAVNGLGTIAAGLFGSCFPTTIYIGHPAWKSMGAKSGYSILNGLFFSGLFLFGCGTILSNLIPIEAGAAIVMYIGVIITAQAFQATPREHAPAVAIAIFPALAALLVVKFPLMMADSGSTVTLAELLLHPSPAAQVPELPGMMALFGANTGWMVTALILTAMGVAFIEKRFRTAAGWCFMATVLSLLGLLHSYRVEDNVVRELFIWQPVPQVAHVGSAATQPVTPAMIASAETTTAKHVFAYRAYPVTAGYALATVAFIVAAAVQRRRDARQELDSDLRRFTPQVGVREMIPAARPEPSPEPEELPSIPLVGDEIESNEEQQSDQDDETPPPGLWPDSEQSDGTERPH